MICLTISIVLKIQGLYHQHFLLSDEALSDGQIEFFTCFFGKNQTDPDQYRLHFNYWENIQTYFE